MGWVARLLGLPRNHPSAAALKRDDSLAFLDGWRDCDQRLDRRLGAGGALFDLLDKSELRAFWVDDANDEVKV
jgi:hypothetical protein